MGVVQNAQILAASFQRLTCFLSSKPTFSQSTRNRTGQMLEGRNLLPSLERLPKLGFRERKLFGIEPITAVAHAESWALT
jgi:hypothetical protein